MFLNNWRPENPEILLSNVNKSKKITEILECLRLSTDTLRQVREVFESEMALGLAKSPSASSSLQMENTYVPELPDGTEEGDFLALDLGGTNFRVMLLQYHKGTVVEECVKYYHVEDDLRLGPGDKLFDFLAECILDFVKQKNLLHRKLPLGFTFSFPMIQKALDVGILVTWTKSFNCSGVVGEDAVAMLNTALDRIAKDTGLNVHVVCVLNDTTGTLLQGAYLDKRCAIGAILGTGSNACYLEKIDRVEKWEGSKDGVSEVIIDIEWGAFGDNGVLDFIKTDFDRQVDDRSLIVNSFTFEKYFSGKYLGEIVRVVLVKLVEEGLVFSGRASEQLMTHNAFTTAFVSQIESDSLENSCSNTARILTEMGLQYDMDDVAVVKHICHVVSVRGTLLVCICLASLLERMNKPHVSVAVDGSLFQHHPRMRPLMEDILPKMAPRNPCDLILAPDGSGKGAAMTAAIAYRLAERKVM